MMIDAVGATTDQALKQSWMLEVSKAYVRLKELRKLSTVSG
eukprot:SAG11_NODE_24569_length_371_cov_1.139706_1_plen_40_part_10